LDLLEPPLDQGVVADLLLMRELHEDVVCEPVSANFGVKEELESVFCEAKDYRSEVTCYGHSAWDSPLI